MLAECQGSFLLRILTVVVTDTPPLSPSNLKPLAPCLTSPQPSRTDAVPGPEQRQLRRGQRHHDAEASRHRLRASSAWLSEGQ